MREPVRPAIWGALAFLLLLSVGSRICLAGCRNDLIMAVADQGAHIATARAGTFQVMRQDLIDPGLWAAGQAVSICAYQSVGQLRLFTMTNLRRSESLMVTVSGGAAAGGQDARGARRRH